MEISIIVVLCLGILLFLDIKDHEIKDRIFWGVFFISFVGALFPSQFRVFLIINAVLLVTIKTALLHGIIPERDGYADNHSPKQEKKIKKITLITYVLYAAAYIYVKFFVLQ